MSVSKRITDLQIKNPGRNRKISESAGGRGDGTLMFWKRGDESIEAYYRYREKGKESLIKIGQYRANRSGYGYSLSECRDKAQGFSRLRREIPIDLKQHL
ncbi:MAG: hypothetical protein ACR2PX_28775 [Endozoicomonas sp.]|uniref:hypothetical protein n=1 Tax=Endozoicomonas sp. TaxID=1892382 RepID=UPI003D9B5B36